MKRRIPFNASRTINSDHQSPITSSARAVAIQADQGNPASAEPLIAQVIEQLGKLDILVNNAAIALQGKTIDDPEIDNAAMDRQWAINTMGVIAA
ncbi:SDR family NAD(P)-dependent oxidoreductase [Paramixta manurensis]|uniref:SDR family NAD(P)-dependent oxidoreductase n=1 Tax=Paramixta manurensis TaxID=2740817 RepID=UPI00339AA000